MKLTLFKKEDFVTTAWSGGTTTQLFICPESADYQKKNFDFRISTARVETEKSTFTKLPGISRKLMILDGEINVFHENHHSKKLKRFGVDEFEGDWETTAEGVCTDFNVMTTNQAKSELSSLKIQNDEQINLDFEDKWNWLFIYVYSGEIRFQILDTELILNAGNLLSINDLKGEILALYGILACEMAIVKIQHK